MSQRSRKHTLLLALLAAFPAGAYAVDGVDRSDRDQESRAVAGNVTPGDTPGFPITITYRKREFIVFPEISRCRTHIRPEL